MYGRAAKAYKRVHVESASKTKVLDELYGRFLRDCQDARTAMEVRDFKAKAEATDHALRIVTELSAALDESAAPELCENLARLYDFVSDRIMDANRRMDPSLLGPAEEVIRSLREAFSEAAESNQ